MPFGLKTACAIFVRLMRKVLKDLRNTECYFDNIVIHNSNWEDHLADLESLLKRQVNASLDIQLLSTLDFLQETAA